MPAARLTVAPRVEEGRRMTSVIMILFLVLNLVWWIVIVQAVMSWLISFDVINLRQPFVYQLWHGLNRLLEPLYRPIRNLLPNMGGLDLSPMILIIAILFLQRLIMVDIARAVLA